MKQITYGALKKPEARKEMLNEDMVSLGTQSGNYGEFKEQARILTLSGANKIKSEVLALCIEKKLDLDIDTALELLPSLRALIK